MHGMTAKKKSRACLQRNWAWIVLKLSVNIELNVIAETVIQ